MTGEEVIKIACEYSLRHGYEPEQYEVTAELANDEWHVFFRGKELRPGNFFSVFVDDRSKNVRELVPGK